MIFGTRVQSLCTTVCKTLHTALLCNILSINHKKRMSMKKSFLFLGAMAMTCLFAPQAMAQNYELRVLSFEDANIVSGKFTGLAGVGNYVTTWSAMIASNQGSDAMLNGASGEGATEQTYSWYDGGNTELFTEFNIGINWTTYEDAWAYWNGGHAISNYWSSDLESYGSSNHQLTVYRPGSNDMNTSGGGHNGSNNFAVHFGSKSAYFDGRPTMTFADGVARVIDHMYVNNTTYLLNEYINGGYCPKANAEDSVSIKATGYDANDQETKTIYFPLCKGNEMGNGVITEWTKWDMTELGAVVSVVFDIVGSDHLEGKAPSYFAYDDVAVRFTKGESTALQETNGPDNTVRKEVRNGRMTIIRDGKTYNAQGVQVR